MAQNPQNINAYVANGMLKLEFDYPTQVLTLNRYSVLQMLDQFVQYLNQTRNDGPEIAPVIDLKLVPRPPEGSP